VCLSFVPCTTESSQSRGLSCADPPGADVTCTLERTRVAWRTHPIQLFFGSPRTAEGRGVSHRHSSCRICQCQCRSTLGSGQAPLRAHWRFLAAAAWAAETAARHQFGRAVLSAFRCVPLNMCLLPALAIEWFRSPRRRSLPICCTRLPAFLVPLSWPMASVNWFRAQLESGRMIPLHAEDSAWRCCWRPYWPERLYVVV